MEYVDFYPCALDEIPDQDCPVKNCDKGLLIVKNRGTNFVAGVIESTSAGVGTERHIANFWNHADAIEYCKLKCGMSENNLNEQ